ncbi:farnesyl pyrophosphate synthase 1-like [Asparagus officinalis]|uniref:farnesyl pyrophosphate synthase 1-like n=1 Tax=Asparagus officinalis TaxID=4686 RepID=UPI00098E42A1|nr:farnesyl pyrophosphate synthase 1-like [Asparagus officinalis]
MVGLIAANDGVLLHNHIPRMLKLHFREKPYYVDLLDLFNEVEFQTASGQMLDLITTHDGEQDLSKYKFPVRFSCRAAQPIIVLVRVIVTFIQFHGLKHP